MTPEDARDELRKYTLAPGPIADIAEMLLNSPDMLESDTGEMGIDFAFVSEDSDDEETVTDYILPAISMGVLQAQHFKTQNDPHAEINITAPMGYYNMDEIIAGVDDPEVETAMQVWKQYTEHTNLDRVLEELSDNGFSERERKFIGVMYTMGTLVETAEHMDRDSPDAAP